MGTHSIWLVAIGSISSLLGSILTTWLTLRSALKRDEQSRVHSIKSKSVDRSIDTIFQLQDAIGELMESCANMYMINTYPIDHYTKDFLSAARFRTLKATYNVAKIRLRVNDAILKDLIDKLIVSEGQLSQLKEESKFDDISKSVFSHLNQVNIRIEYLLNMISI